MAKPIPVTAKLVRKLQLTSDVIELHFAPEPEFDFLPGQFMSIVIPGAGPGGRDLRRAYSIASAPENKIIELCVKVVEGGPGTQYLNGLRLGDSIKANTPFGDFVYKPAAGRAAMMIATGTGIAPFRSMILSKVYQDQKPTQTHLLFGAREAGDLLYTESLTAALGPKGFIQALSRPKPQDQWNGFKGRVTDYLREQATQIPWSETEFYLCGNGAMIDEVKQILSAHAVEKSAIHQEVYYKPKPGETHASQT